MRWIILFLAVLAAGCSDRENAGKTDEPITVPSLY